MSEATQYNTYCESQLQLPVTELLPITNVKGKSGYIAIRTLVKTADGRISRAKATGYWPDNRPVINSMLVGPIMLAVTIGGVEMCFERLQLETRPGDPKHASYIQNHLGHDSWRVRVLGKVVASSAMSFTVTGQTFLVTGASKFTVKLVSTSSIPNVPTTGEFAGGSGVVESISKSPPFLVVRLETLHVAVATQAPTSEPAQAPSSSAWMAAFQGDTSVPTGGETASAEQGADDVVQLTPVNSYCETTFRFPLFGSERLVQGWSRVQSKTLTTDGCSHLFYVNVMGLDQLPPAHSIATITAAVALDGRQILMSSTKNHVTLRPGNPLDPEYKAMQILKQPWRIRAAGRVVVSLETEWVMAAVVPIGNAIHSVAVRFMVPSTEKAGPRWVSYRCPALGTFACGRGFVEQVAYGMEHKFVVTLESATNAIQSDAVIPLNQTAAAGEDWLQAWQTPPPHHAAEADTVTSGNVPSSSGLSSFVTSDPQPGSAGKEGVSQTSSVALPELQSRSHASAGALDLHSSRQQAGQIQQFEPSTQMTPAPHHAAEADTLTTGNVPSSSGLSSFVTFDPQQGSAGKEGVPQTSSAALPELQSRSHASVGAIDLHSSRQQAGPIQQFEPSAQMNPFNFSPHAATSAPAQHRGSTMENTMYSPSTGLQQSGSYPFGWPSMPMPASIPSFSGVPHSLGGIGSSSQLSSAVVNTGAMRTEPGATDVNMVRAWPNPTSYGTGSQLSTQEEATVSPVSTITPSQSASIIFDLNQNGSNSHSSATPAETGTSTTATSTAESGPGEADSSSAAIGTLAGSSRASQKRRSVEGRQESPTKRLSRSISRRHDSESRPDPE